MNVLYLSLEVSFGVSQKAFPKQESASTSFGAKPTCFSRSSELRMVFAFFNC